MNFKASKKRFLVKHMMSLLLLTCLMMRLVVLAAAQEQHQSEKKKLTFEQILLASNLWKMPAKTAVSAFAQNGKFHWVSSEQNRGISFDKKITFLGMRCTEVFMTFNQNKLSEIKVTFYDQLRSRDLKYRDFEGKIMQLSNTIGKISKVEYQESMVVNVSGHRMLRRLWVSKRTLYRLEYGYSREGLWGRRPKFMTLTLCDAESHAHLLDQRGQIMINNKRLDSDSRILYTKDNGDRWIKVQMIEQGPEGYCGPASLERAMCYFGVDVDKYLVAALSMANEGTEASLLLGAINSMAPQTGLKAVPLSESVDATGKRIIKAYNARAKKGGKQVLDIPFLSSYEYIPLFRKMDKDLYFASQKASEREYNKFFTKIKDRVDKKLPCIWSVVVGMHDEKPSGPKGIFGHVRLIIGYNEKTKEIIYTDSWGAAHEFKRIDLEVAHAITLHMFSVEPKMIK